MDIKIQLPLIAVAAQETESEGEAQFDNFVPDQKQSSGRSISTKPKWVKSLPKTKTVWSPITIDKTVFLFQSEELAKYVANEEKLPFVYGTLDFISLETPEDVSGWLQKAGAEKVKLFMIAAPPSDPLNQQIATSEVSVSEFNLSRVG